MSQQHSTLELVDETLHLAIRYLDTFLNRRGAHPPRPPRANPPNPEFKISTQTRKPRLEKRARLLKNIELTIQTCAGTESFLARNGAGSEPVPAIPLQPLQANHVLYLNNEELYQPLCNKLKRLGITCIFVAAKVSV